MSFETRALASTAVCHGVVHILELAYGVLLFGIAAELGASLFIMGLLANIFGLAFGFTALPSGFLADRIGERRLLAICCLLSGIAAIGVGLSVNVYLLGLALLLLGLALGLYHPAGAAFVAKTSCRPGMAFGYLGIGGNLGVAVAPIMVGSIAAILNWRAAYLLLAIPMVLLSIVFYFGIRNSQRVEREDVPPDVVRAPDHRLRITFLSLVLAAQFLNGLIYRGVVTFLPLYLGLSAGYASNGLSLMFLAGSVTTVVLLFGVGGQFLGGYLSDRFRAERLALVVCLGSFPLLITMGITFGPVLVMAACIFAVFHFMGQPVFNVLVSDNSPVSWRGRVFGFSFFSNFGLGSFSAGLLGHVADRIGLNWVFPVASGFAILALVVVLVLIFQSKVM
ncbi:MAG: MFS transporter, partial [Dehalococcoidia bacterium]|nr:MFS transporter [Dehalococcoidia bacterium]